MGGPAAPAPDGRRPRWSKDAEKYLLPHEQPPVIATRRHWAVLVVPVAKSLPALVVGSWLLMLDPDNGVTASVGLLVLVGALGYLALRVGEWWMRHFIVTNRRVLLTSGIIVRTVALLPLRRITDLTYKETLLGQLLGYGTFRFESAGQQQALSEITYLPRADVLYRDVSDLLFGGNGAGGGDDEGEAEPSPQQPRRSADRPRPDAAGDGRRDTQPIPPLPPRRARSPRVAGRRVRQSGR
ncbi:PH domain-containing protein [Geodermatophilus africanus]|uniref:PH domain-containing protein n=1 Tax=Geodermatophilus africanus TaxID=1137993 RepID=A0A1H3EEC1_9ACTN|nr:PH domain-containing protein [Geodermatophilus africanus]SDX77056.1 PH domain-containing protein [Geodermatophilus africanus]